MKIKQLLLTIGTSSLILSLTQCERSSISTEATTVVESNSISGPVAEKVATNFWHSVTSSNSASNAKLGANSHPQPTPLSLEVKKVTNYVVSKDTALHIIEFQKGGWTVVAADRRVNPIMAYSEKGNFPTANMEGGVLVWMKLIASQIKDVRKGIIPPNPKVAQLWQQYDKSQEGTGKDNPGAGTNVQQPVCDPNNISCPTQSSFQAGPVIQEVNWRQTGGYANNSPDRSFTGSNCANCFNNARTGCGPLAIALVLFYYNRFEGSNKPSGYNFTTNAISSSCGNLSPGELEIARLIRYAGDNSSTNYNEPQCNTATLDVTSTTIPFARAGYSNDGDVVDFFSNQGAVMGELSSRRPIIFSGTTCGTCLGDYHIWVCHGIRTFTNYTPMCAGGQFGTPVCSSTNSIYFKMDWGQGGAWNGDWYGLGDFRMNGDAYDTYMKAHINIRP